ncbi:unnamed protein product [Soboliphyme baturini]|uniref:Uncharacterized protein n=1 Tax=Soboliphyme baturini TaxID=241478 RepID=A0A183IH83_9BILA|nr:unnamed protein product [Soboliphyme baturini]
MIVVCDLEIMVFDRGGVQSAAKGSPASPLPNSPLSLVLVRLVVNPIASYDPGESTRWRTSFPSPQRPSLQCTSRMVGAQPTALLAVPFQSRSRRSSFNAHSKRLLQMFRVR